MGGGGGILILLIDARTVGVADDRLETDVISGEWCGAGRSSLSILRNVGWVSPSSFAILSAAMIPQLQLGIFIGVCPYLAWNTVGVS